MMSCNSAKEKTNHTMIDFSKEGFTEVEYMKSSTCNFILTTSSGEKFETENISDDILNSKSKTFWIKYNSLRRMSKCDNTTPIQITEFRINE